MNFTEVTAAMTAAANVIAAQLTNTQANQLGAVFILLGQLLQTIAIIRPDDNAPPLQGSNIAAQGEAASPQGQSTSSQGQSAAPQGDDPAASEGKSPPSPSQSGDTAPPTATT